MLNRHHHARTRLVPSVQPWIAGLSVISLFLADPLEAQDLREPPPDIHWNTLENSEPWPEDLRTMESLPDPPEDLRGLLRIANLQIQFYDPARFPRRFTGETRMAVRYQLDFNYRWSVERSGRTRFLVAEVSRQPTRFEFYHQMLLPIDHAEANLYTRPLVQHELDHVRISTDERYRNLFEQWFRADTETLKIELELRATEKDYPQLIQSEVQGRAEQSFQRLLQLIQVRNRELDRLTQHGRKPRPDDFFKHPPVPEPRRQ